MAEPKRRLPSLRHIDQILIWLAVTVLVAVAWRYLVDMASSMRTMPDMAVTHGGMSNLLQAGEREWQWVDFWRLWVMWAVMMIAMMVPTAVRTLMIFARISHARSQAVISPTYLFLSGYILVWSGFSVLATLLQWQLDQAALLSPMMVSTSPVLAASLLGLAGVYQSSSLKQRCLQHCQAPMGFISEQFRPGYTGALVMGLIHGAYCLGCCWLLMGLLFIAGVMNVLWVLLITLLVMCEKLLPLYSVRLSRVSGRLSGMLLVAAGVVVLLF